MEFFYEMSPFELIHEAVCISLEVAKRSKEWDNASTEEENELTEQSYYDAVDHYRLVQKVIQKRGLLSAYKKYSKFIFDEGLI